MKNKQGMAISIKRGPGVKKSNLPPTIQFKDKTTSGDLFKALQQIATNTETKWSASQSAPISPVYTGLFVQDKNAEWQQG